MRFNLIKDRIFLFAIGLSLILHIFWLSVVTVVAPKKTLPVKFSKVSFLGPILTRGAIDLRMEQKKRSLLEERYTGIVNKRQASKNAQTKDPYVLCKDTWQDDNRALPEMINEAISGDKLEPLDL